VIDIFLGDKVVINNKKTIDIAALTRSADAGNIEDKFRLAVLYSMGTSEVKRDVGKALFLLSEVRKQGSKNMRRKVANAISKIEGAAISNIRSNAEITQDMLSCMRAITEDHPFASGRKSPLGRATPRKRKTAEPSR